MLKQLICVAVLLVGCSDKPVPNQAEKRQERLRDAAIILSKTPEPRTHNFSGNQLLVVGIPSVDIAGFVNMQNCYVWRDNEYKTSTISCPATQDAPDIPWSDPPDNSNHYE